MNYHLREYGTAHFGLLRVEYVIAGLVWAYLAAFAYFAAQYVRHRISENWKWWRDEIAATTVAKALGNTLTTLLLVFALPSFFLAALGAVTDWFSWKGWAAAMLLVISGRVTVKAIRDGETAARRFREHSLFAKKDRATLYSLIYTMMLFVALLGVYAEYVYPKLSPVFGGGKPRSVALVIKSDQVTTCERLGFKMTSERTTEPLELVLETEGFFLVLPPRAMGKAPEVKAVRIRKDLIDSVLYFDPRRERGKSAW